MTKDRSDSFVHVVIRDEGVRRACADVVLALLAAFAKPSHPTEPDNK